MLESLEEKFNKIKKTKKTKGLTPCKKYSYSFDGMDVSRPELFSLNQVHGCDIVCADKETNKTSGDVLYTQASQLAIGVKTADCIPILCFCPKDDLAFAIHAGWRGLAQNIITKTLNFFSLHLDIKKQNIHCILGPCIGFQSFEIKNDVYKNLLYSASKSLQSLSPIYSKELNSHRFLFDLRAFASLTLLEQNISCENISIIDYCTYETKNKWYSYRRDSNNLGRNWAWIQRL